MGKRRSSNDHHHQSRHFVSGGVSISGFARSTAALNIMDMLTVVKVVIGNCFPDAAEIFPR